MFHTIRSVLQGEHLKNLLKRTGVFVGIFVVTWLPYWVRTLFFLLKVNSGSFFSAVASIVGSLSGILNCMVWLFLFPDLKTIYGSTHQKKKEATNAYERSTSINVVDANEKISSKKPTWKRDWETKKSELSSDCTGTYLLDPRLDARSY